MKHARTRQDDHLQANLRRCILAEQLAASDVVARSTLRGHINSVECIRFSPDGRWVASGSADETVRLWDIATGTCLQILRADGPYQGMNIAGVSGINEAQKAVLKILGAVDEAPQ